MKISKAQLQKIISEEVYEHVKKQLMSETKVKPQTIKATPDMLQKIIAEEVAKAKSDRLTENRKMVKATPELLRRIIAEEKAKLS